MTYLNATSIHPNLPQPSKGFSIIINVLFYIFTVYLAVPLYDVPLLGLSLSAPIFFLIAVAVFFRPPTIWFRRYRLWIIVAVFIGIGIFSAAVGNGLISGGVSIDTKGIATVIHYAYWLLVFVVTAYFASQPKIARQTAKLLGWEVFILVLLRWGEVLVYRNIGAEVGTHLLTQNNYGFLFSALSPFLLIFLLQARGLKFLLAVVANILLWGAAAINGSRGSWISISIGLGVALVLLLL